MSPSSFAVTLILLAVPASAAPLTVTNCTQKKLPIPGCRSAISVMDTIGVFVMETHSDGNNTGHVDIYNATDKTFRTMTMPTPSRTNMCATTWKHLAIFAGGGPNRGQPKSKIVNVFDTITGEWSTYNMSIGRDLLACASVGDLTLFAGGSAPQANQSETDVVDIWNHKTGEWSQAKLSQRRKKPEAVTVGSQILFAAGEIGHHPPNASELGSYSDVIDIFDMETMTWSATTIPYPPRQYFGAVQAGGVAVFGGGFYNDIRLNNVNVYDPVSGWKEWSPLSANRSNLHASAVANGRYAAFGSGNIHPDAKVTFDFYDSETGSSAASHAHAPGNPAVVGIKNTALFLGCDGVFDALALNDPTCDGWNVDETTVLV